MLRFLGLGGIGARDLRLQTERIVLRTVKLTDFNEWARLRRENQSFLQPWEPLWPRDHTSYRAFRRRVIWSQREAQQLRGITLLMCLPKGGPIVGGITLSNIRGHPLSSGKLGYWIGQRHARQGYMTEAVDALTEYAFDDLSLIRVEAACLAENSASRALLERCGFQYEGVAQAYLEVNGVTRDHLLYARVKERS